MKWKTKARMPRFRKKGYRFADDLISTDTLISFIFGIGSLLISVLSVIYGIVKKGIVGERIGILLVIAWVMAITGLIFGMFSFGTVEGGNNQKRYSVMLSVIAIAVLIILYFI